MSYITKIRNNFKYLKNLFPSILYYYQITSKRQNISDNGEYAFINLDNRIMNQSGGRFAFLLCKYFEKAGYKIILKIDFLSILLLDPEKKLLLQENYLFVRNIGIEKNSVVIKSKNKKQRQLSIYYGIKNLQINKYDYVLPFPVHPVQVEHYNHQKLIGLRKEKRTIKLLFSGTWKLKQYQQSLEKYNVISRYEALSFIIEKFNNNSNLKLISSKDEFDDVLNNNRNNEKIIISDAKCTDEDWLRLLSLADFFISPPGYKYPWCHNSIEAMAVGTIPILQYNHLFTPQLMHMENCISYNNLSELEEAITKALSMKNDEIERIRKNVIDYYDQHLSTETVANIIKNLICNSKNHLSIIIPYIVTGVS